MATTVTRSEQAFNRDEVVKFFQEKNVANMEKVQNTKLSQKERPEVFKATGGGAWGGWGKGSGSPERFAEILRIAFDKRPTN